MARLLSPPARYGTYCGLCVYRMRGEDFVRKASSLTAKRVKKEKAFKPTLAWADRLKMASSLASAVYAMLPAYRRKHKRYRDLTGLAMRLLTEGHTEGATVVELMLSLQMKKRIRKRRAVVSREAERATARVMVNQLSRQNAVRRIVITKRKTINRPAARLQPASIRKTYRFSKRYRMAPGDAPPFFLRCSYSPPLSPV